MPNRHRGEIEAEIGGARRRLVLTLGALAELEASFGADDLVALAERFGGGRLTARDLVRDEEVAAMTTPDAAAGFVRIAADLLAATFGDRAGESERASVHEGAAANPPSPQAAARA